MKIRFAKRNDIKGLIDLLIDFNSEFECFELVGGIDNDVVQERLLSIWDMLKIWVCTDNWRIVSALAMVEFLNPFSGRKALEELFWYALPEIRGEKECSLFDYMEEYAIESGYKYIAMSSMNTSHVDILKKFYTKRGFKLHQFQYFKQIKGGYDDYRD